MGEAMHRVLLPFEFSEPGSVAEAVALIDGDRVRAMAGGVDLVLKMRLRHVTPERVVSLQKIPGLDHVREDARFGRDGGLGDGRGIGAAPALLIGALATLRRVEQAATVQHQWPLLAEALGSIVSMQTKAMGTLAGNLCVGTPASDVAPALYALGAHVRIAGESGEWEIPIEEFFVDAGKTAVRPHELVTEIIVPAPAAGSAGAFLKLAKTAEDIAKVNAAVCLALSDGVCSYVRIAVGSAAPTPVRAAAAERVLAGRRLDAGVATEAAEAAADSVCPISDVRSTAGYRKDMVRILVRDALLAAAARASGASPNAPRGNLLAGGSAEGREA
jgi:aerobic carbon-monoxide dehydrogenase medium subunit